MKRLTILALGLAGVFGVVAPAFAEVITGHIGFTGALIYDNRMDPTQGTPCGIAANPTCQNAVLDFAPLNDGPGGFVDGIGEVVVAGSHTGYFVGIPSQPPLIGATAVTILDLRNFVSGTDPATFAPAGVTLNVVNFLNNFTSAGLPLMYNTLHFDLTQIVVQPGTPCGSTLALNDTCVLGPFSLTQTAEGVKINFDVQGYFRNPVTVNNPTADEGFYTGSFSNVLNGMGYSTLFDRLANSGLDLGCDTSANFLNSCTFSANFDPVSAVPEPTTLATFGVGVLLFGAHLRRQQRKRATTV